MASLLRFGKGRKVSYGIQLCIGRKKSSFRIGRVGHEDANHFKTQVKQLEAAMLTNGTPPPAVSAWVDGLPDHQHERLARVGLVQPRHPVTEAPGLKAWIERFLEQRPDLKGESVKKIRRTGELLTEHFGEELTIDAITADAAAGWRAWLAARPIRPKSKTATRKPGKGAGEPPKMMQEATLRLHCRNAKLLMNEAARRDLIPKNPFRNLTSTAVAAGRDRYISPAELDQLVESLPDAHWRMLAGLARLAGLRMPSETHTLTWGDVDWSRWRVTVRSAKTERYKGKESRVVPIGPKLQTLTLAVWELPETERNGERVVTLSRNNLHRTIRAAIKRAGLTSWEDLCQALRRSCETEWSLTDPAHVTAAWLGHSEAVARKHYLQIPEYLYECATDLRTETTAAGVDAEGSVIARIGMRATGIPDDEWNDCTGPIVSSTEHGAFIRDDKTGEIRACPWDKVDLRPALLVA